MNILKPLGAVAAACLSPFAYCTLLVIGPSYYQTSLSTPHYNINLISVNYLPVGCTQAQYCAAEIANDYPGWGAGVGGTSDIPVGLYYIDGLQMTQFNNETPPLDSIFENIFWYETHPNPVVDPGPGVQGVGGTFTVPNDTYLKWVVRESVSNLQQETYPAPYQWLVPGPNNINGGTPTGWPFLYSNDAPYTDLTMTNDQGFKELVNKFGACTTQNFYPAIWVELSPYNVYHQDVFLCYYNPAAPTSLTILDGFQILYTDVRKGGLLPPTPAPGPTPSP
jgi:hypothetical protein